MVEINTEGVVITEKTVEVNLEEYRNLIISQEHLRNIYKMAFNGAVLGYYVRDLRLDASAVEQYLKCIFSDECKLKYEELKKEHKAEEANEQPDNN